MKTFPIYCAVCLAAAFIVYAAAPVPAVAHAAEAGQIIGGDCCANTGPTDCGPGACGNGFFNGCKPASSHNTLDCKVATGWACGGCSSDFQCQ